MRKNTKKWCCDLCMQFLVLPSYRWRTLWCILSQVSIFRLDKLQKIRIVPLYSLMKKFSLFLVLVFSFFVGSSLVSAKITISTSSCPETVNWENAKSLFEKCKPNNAVGVDNTTNLSIDKGNGFKEKVTQWTRMIAIISALGAVGALVYAGMLMQFSGGNDDTINKAKEIIKITLIGTALITVAGWLVYLVITMIFGIAGT